MKISLLCLFLIISCSKHVIDLRTGGVVTDEVPDTDPVAGRFPLGNKYTKELNYLRYMVSGNDESKIFATALDTIEIYDKEDNLLTTFGSTGSGANQFSTITDMAKDPLGNLVIVDNGNRRIQKIGPGGTNLLTFDSWTEPVEQQIVYPNVVKADSQGNIYFSNQSGMVVKLSPSHELMFEIGSNTNCNIAVSDTELCRPRGLAVDANYNLYVSDSYNHTVKIFDADGVFVRSIGSEGTGDGQFSYPHGVAVDSSGNVFVVDQQNFRVQKFDNNGNFVLSFGSFGSGPGQFSFPYGINLDSSNNIYVADTLNHRIQKFDPSGNFLAEFGGFGAADGLFNYPMDVIVDAAGDILVVDQQNYRIQKFTSMGIFASKIDLPSYSMSSLSLKANGDILVNDGTSNLISGVITLSASGVLLDSFSSYFKDTTMFFTNPQEVAVDHLGNVYVTDPGSFTAYKFSYLGELVAKFGGYGGSDGNFISMGSMAVNNSGEVYIAEPSKSRIQIFNNNGTFLDHFGSAGTSSSAFNGIRDIVINSLDEVFVGDSGNFRIQIFDSAGNYLSEIPTGDFAPMEINLESSDSIFMLDLNSVIQIDQSGAILKDYRITGTQNGQFQYPQDIARDDQENIYVADTDNMRIQKFSKSGEHLLTIDLPVYPAFLALDGQNNLYISDWSDGIYKFNSSGDLLASFGDYPDAIDDIEFGGIAVDGENNVYAIDYGSSKIVKFNSDGDFLLSFGQYGSSPGEFESLDGIAIGQDATVYVLDSSKATIQKFTPAGLFMSEISGDFDGLWSLSIDGSGNLYAGDWTTVNKFDASGSLILTFGTGISGMDAGDINGASGMEVDGDGNLLVVESQNHRVQKFNSSGTVVFN